MEKILLLFKNKRMLFYLKVCLGGYGCGRDGGVGSSSFLSYSVTTLCNQLSTFDKLLQ